MRAVFTLTSAESKRLLGKAVAQLPAVKRALQKGRVIIGGGTTNAYVAEEILGIEVDKAKYTAGIITGGVQCVTPAEDRLAPYSIVDGEVTKESWLEVLADFTADDVFIKGANAVDAEGHAGVLMSNPKGGTIGQAIGTLAARGSKLIIPVGLEKMIPSVELAAAAAGINTFDYSLGQRVGLMPLMYGEVITEIEALDMLTGVDAVCIAAGGVGGSEGSVTLSVEGSEGMVGATLDLIKGIKGEKPIPQLKQKCQCGDPCNRF
ncbi:hypothetical protein V6C27_11030 [Peptococcaceae bacterium 1198_IL3148]